MIARSSACASAASSDTAAMLAAARAGSRSASTAAARAWARTENSFCETASCSSRASRARSSAADSSRLSACSRALVSAIAACAANSVSSSSSRGVNSPPAVLSAAKMMPSTWSPPSTGTPRKAPIGGCACGSQPPNRGSAVMSGSRSGRPPRSSSASIPCWRGSAPIARCWASVSPDTTNSPNEPPSSGTPSAAMRAPATVRAESTITCSTWCTGICRETASTARLTSDNFIQVIQALRHEQNATADSATGAGQRS